MPNRGGVFKACKSLGWMAQSYLRFPSWGTALMGQAAEAEFFTSEELEQQTQERKRRMNA